MVTSWYYYEYTSCSGIRQYRQKIGVFFSARLTLGPKMALLEDSKYQTLLGKVVPLIHVHLIAISGQRYHKYSSVYDVLKFPNTELWAHSQQKPKRFGPSPLKWLKISSKPSELARSLQLPIFDTRRFNFKMWGEMRWYRSIFTRSVIWDSKKTRMNQGNNIA